jgi:Transcription factor zinc-finger
MTGPAGSTVPLSTVDLATRERLPRTCPACGVPGLEVRTGAERAVLVCRRCQGSWVVEMGYLVPLGTVAPA